MSVDSVPPILANLAVHPGQDAQDERNREPRREGHSRHSGKDEQQPADPHPVVNELGQVMGRTINITA